jgi:hypothetical protein
MDRIRFIEHRGQQVLLVDFSDSTPQEMEKIAGRIPDTTIGAPMGSLLLLADFSRAEFTRESFERVKVTAALNQPHLKRSAWVLTDNLPKALHDSVESFSSREIPIFATREEALDYLVS